MYKLIPNAGLFMVNLYTVELRANISKRNYTMTEKFFLLVLS